jgi:hypothetical protein
MIRIRPSFEQRFDNLRRRAAAFHVANQRRAAQLRDAVGIDSPREALDHLLDIAAPSGQTEQRLEASLVLGMVN